MALMGDTQLFKVQSVPSQGKATTPRQRFSFSFLHAAPFAEHTMSILLLGIPVLSFAKTCRSKVAKTAPLSLPRL